MQNSDIEATQPCKVGLRFVCSATYAVWSDARDAYGFSSVGSLSSIGHLRRTERPTVSEPGSQGPSLLPTGKTGLASMGW